MKEAVFSSIDGKYKEFLDVWQDVANLESPTPYRDGVNAVGNYFIRYAERYGWQVEICRQEIAGDAVCITMNADAKGAPIALSGHMDTVHKVGSFGNPAASLDETRIFGPGITDCKGGLVAALLAMSALEESGYRERPVMLLLQSVEEQPLQGSSAKTLAFMCEKAKDCAAFLNLECNRPGKAILRRKGIMGYRLHVHGRAAHSSACATMGVSAIAEAAHKIIKLEKIKSEDGITINCGLIEGGTAKNTVPDLCTVTVDIRYATSRQREEAAAIVERIAGTSYIDGTYCEAESFGGRVAMEPCERNEKLLEDVNRALAVAGMSTLIPCAARGGSDASNVTAFGIPCLDGFGVQGGNIHSREEYAELASLTEAARRIASVILYL